MSDKEANARLVALMPQLRAQARHYVIRYNRSLDDLDVALEAAKSFLERVQEDLTFLDLDDSDIVDRVVKDGWNRVRAFYYQERRQVSFQNETDDGEGFDGLEFAFANDESARPVEDAVCANELAERVQQIVAGLKPTYQAVARGIMAGLPKGEIMQSIGAAPQAFTHYRRQLAYALWTVNAGEIAA